MKALAKALDGKRIKTVSIDGLAGSSCPLVFASIAERLKKPIVFILRDADEAGYFYHDLMQLGAPALFFPSSYKRAVKYGQRDAANEMCRVDKQAVDLILDHYKNPGRYMDQANCFHNHMKDRFEKGSEKCEVECDIPSEKCDEGRKQDAVRRESAEGMDAFDLPHGMVMMSTGTLGTMQDDMLALAYAVDQLVDAFNDIAEGGGYDRNKMNIITGSASDLARDVFNRWDDAEMAVLS